MSGVTVVAGAPFDDVGVNVAQGSSYIFGGELGMLRVTTSPALASQILIDGQVANSWGLDWLKLQPGTYTLSFTHVEGYTEPAPQQVTITSGQTTTVNATFPQRGGLRVITSPAVPGTITVDGVARNNWGLWTDVPTGSHQVCFGPVADNPPSCENAMVNAGQLTTITGMYASNPGAPGETGKGELRVTTQPNWLGSQILVAGQIANSSGLDWLKLAPGQYNVRFLHVEGYTEPATQQVTITAGQTTTQRDLHAARIAARDHEPSGGGHDLGRRRAAKRLGHVDGHRHRQSPGLLLPRAGLDDACLPERKRHGGSADDDHRRVQLSCIVT